VIRNKLTSISGIENSCGSEGSPLEIVKLTSLRELCLEYKVKKYLYTKLYGERTLCMDEYSGGESKQIETEVK